MSKRKEPNFNAQKTNSVGGLKKVKKVKEITEYILEKNGLRVLYVPRKGTGVITTNIVYFVGARDEAVGETGLAHIFEHMLFKPTHYDLKRKQEPAIMRMEREIGATINANTWKDRTTYYIAYPKEHFERALRVETERMRGLVLSEEEFRSEQGNVLSEFDMYAGDEQYALSVQMLGVAFQSHPYGHETIGYREDIVAFTTAKLQAFYDKYYAPNNAMLTVIGDVSEAEMITTVTKLFSPLKKSETLKEKTKITEPKQEGVRTITVERPSATQVYAIGVKHDGFPSKSWFETMAIFDMLAGGDDSILHRELVDTGLATSVSASLEPSRERNLGIIFVTLTKKSTHESIHKKIHNIVNSLTVKIMAPYLKKTIAKSVSHEFTSRENSLGYTAELVEYVSAGAWEHFFDTEKILMNITPNDIKTRLRSLFTESQTTIGYFKGTK